MTTGPARDATEHSAAVAYARSLERWGMLQRRPKEANAEFDRGEALLGRLLNSEAGRTAVEALLSHPDQWVRLRAASHALGWAPDLAQATLAQLAADGKDGCGVSAKYTWLEFTAGRLPVARPTD